MDTQKLKEYVASIDHDIYIYAGDITGSGADILISKIIQNPKRRTGCSLLLCTYGGDPNAAYRMARALKRAYCGFSVYVFGFCKSAGTLIAVAADEIIMTEFGELGPLDIQLPKVDELNHESGLVYSQALSAIKAHAFDFFESCYLDLKTKSGGAITTKTASSIATELATGIFAPLAQQIDPLKVGEITRAMEITYAYGTRLTKNTKALGKLIHGYADHGFVIDYEEAKDLLENVRPLNQDEEEAFGEIISVLRQPGQQLSVAFLDDILNEEADCGQNRETDDASQQTGDGSNQGTIQEDDGDCSQEQPEGDHHPEADAVSEEQAGETQHPERLPEEVADLK